MMDKPQKVTAFLKVTAEFYDPEATPETVRYSVEQTLEDAGYDVDVDCVFPDEETFCQYMARNYLPPNADREKLVGMSGQLALDYLELCWKEHFGKDNNVPCKSDVPDTNAGKWVSVKDRLPEPTDEYTDYIVHIVDDEGNWAIGIAEYEIALGVGLWRIGPDGNTLPDGMYITHWMNTPEPPEE